MDNLIERYWRSDPLNKMTMVKTIFVATFIFDGKFERKLQNVPTPVNFIIDSVKLTNLTTHYKMLKQCTIEHNLPT